MTAESTLEDIRENLSQIRDMVDQIRPLVSESPCRVKELPEMVKGPAPLVMISPGVAIQAAEIAGVEVNGARTMVVIRTKDGRTYTREPEYRSSVWDTFDKMVGEINLAIGATK